MRDLKTIIGQQIYTKYAWIEPLTLFTMGGGGRVGQKDPPIPVFPLKPLQTKELAPKTSGLLVLTLLPHWCKISSFYLVQYQIIELEPRPPL